MSKVKWVRNDEKINLSIMQKPFFDRRVEKRTLSEAKARLFKQVYRKMAKSEGQYIFFSFLSLLRIFAFTAFFFVLSCNFSNENTNQAETNTESESIQQTVQPKLSSNKKVIVAGEQALLEVNHADIMNYFKAEGNLCDPYYLNRPERNAFCTDKNIFKQKTQFNAIDVSADNTAIGFSLTSEVMSPDAVVGVFYPKRDDQKIHLITRYYLGNEFLGFAPDSKHFVFQHNCWESFCGLTVKNTATLQTVLEINNPESVDERSDKTVFEQWIDNQTISYLINGEPAKISF